MARPRSFALAVVALAVAIPARSRAGDVIVTVRGGDGRPLEGAVAWIASTGHGPGTTAGPPVILDQRGFAFVPPLLVARRGQVLEVRNSDAESHNVNVHFCCPMNVNVAPGEVHRTRLDVPGVATVLCNIHAQMRAVIVVVDGPHALTGAHGEAKIESVPDGPRFLHVYALDHERPAPVALHVVPSGVSVVLDLVPQPSAVTVVASTRASWSEIASRMRQRLDETRHAARRGEVALVRAAIDDALRRHFRGEGLYAALRSDRGQLRAYELERRIEGLGRDLVLAATVSDAGEREGRVSTLEPALSELLADIGTAAGSLRPQGGGR